jgi:hypothetical protein
MIRKLARHVGEAYRCIGVEGGGVSACCRVGVSASSRVGVSAGLAKRPQLRRRPPSYHRCVEKQSPSLKERSAGRRAWLVGRRSRAIRRRTSDVDVRCSASDSRCTRRVRRGTFTERAKVKIAEPDKKGPQHRKRRTARRPEALYPSFPRSCVGCSRFMDVPRRTRARPYQPHAWPRRPADAFPTTPHAPLESGG